MSDWQAIFLALVQGITEFLPISSSGHLILVPALLGWEDQGLAFDVAVHVGTLLAIVLAMWHRLWPVLRDGVPTLWTFKLATPNARLAWGIVVGTIPVGIVGLVFKDFIEANLRGPLVIAATTIGFGFVLWWADRRAKCSKSLDQLSWADYLLVGLAQCLALIPGTSRSGITISMALMTGANRKSAAEFSFLLAVPAVLLPGLLKSYELAQSGLSVDWRPMLIGMLVSFVSAWIVTKLFLRWIEVLPMSWFFVYRLLLGTWLIIVFA